MPATATQWGRMVTVARLNPSVNGEQQIDCNHGTIEHNHGRHGACAPAGRRRKQGIRASDTSLVHRRRNVKFLA